MNLEEQLVSILSQHCGERGQTEGAVDTLERILREKTDLEAKVCVMREALTILAGLPDSEGTTHTAELHDVTHAARFAMEALSSVPACIHKEELVELRRANQKAAGYRVDRCACVFPDDNDDPSQECGYHKNLREQLAILQAALDGANRWHENDTNVIRKTTESLEEMVAENDKLQVALDEANGKILETEFKADHEILPPVPVNPGVEPGLAWCRGCKKYEGEWNERHLWSHERWTEEAKAEREKTD